MDANNAISSQAAISTAIKTSFTAFANHIAGLKEAGFTYTPIGKWSAGQHLEHLLRSTQPVYKALGLPAFVLRLLFGKPSRQGRTYSELVAKYKAKLSIGGVATGRYVPPVIHFTQKDDKLQQFVQLQQKLERRVLRLSNNKLDHCRLPHPLLGKLTLREMLYFTIYHTEHHLERLHQQ